MTTFSPVQRTRVADQVAVAIRDAIVAGEYGVGDRLPAERDLAQQFGVNRSSVREALQQLSAWGLVDVRQGGGATVADLLAVAGVQMLPWLLAPHGEVDPSLMRDLLHVRVALLGLTGDWAARNAEPHQVGELNALVDRLVEARGADRIQALDYEFFEALIRAGGNRVLGLLAGTIGRVYAENRELFLALYPDDVIDTTIHRTTVSAIEAGDASGARGALEAYGLLALVVFEEEAG